MAILADGRTVIGGKVLDEAALKAAFGDAQGRNPEMVVLVQADEGVPHGRVVHVMELARELGLTRLAIATRAEPRSPRADGARRGRSTRPAPRHRIPPSCAANPEKRLGELLLEAGVIDAAQLQAALGHQRQWGARLGQALVDLKLVAEADIVQRALAQVRVRGRAARRRCSHTRCSRRCGSCRASSRCATTSCPWPLTPAPITVAMSDPTNLSVVDELRFRTGRRVRVCVGGDREIAAARAPALSVGAGPRADRARPRRGRRAAASRCWIRSAAARRTRSRPSSAAGPAPARAPVPPDPRSSPAPRGLRPPPGNRPPSGPPSPYPE